MDLDTTKKTGTEKLKKGKVGAVSYGDLIRSVGRSGDYKTRCKVVLLSKVPKVADG